MDSARARELCRLAFHDGASDAVAVEKHVIARTDSLRNGSYAHEVSDFTEEWLKCAVGNAEISCRLNPLGASETDDAQCVKNAVEAAKLAAVWGVSSEHRPYAEVYTEQSIQKCEEIRARLHAFDEVPQEEKKLACKKDDCSGICFQTSCFGKAEWAAAPILPVLAQKVRAVSAEAVLEAEQTISDVRHVCWIGEEFRTFHHYETRLCQRVRVGSRTADLPDYLFDGAGIDPDGPEHLQLLTADKIASGLCQATHEMPEMHRFTGILLSPWTVALLAHSARHLGISIASSRLVLSMDACLFEPPRTESPCKPFALSHAGSAHPTMKLLFARVPSHALCLDAPMRCVRFNTYQMDIEFGIVCEINEHAFWRYYEPLTVRFDLRTLWGACTETAEPTCRAAIRCGGEHAVCQSPWAYFAVKPTAGRM